MANIASLVATWREVLETRQDCERVAEELKEIEKTQKEKIINYLNATGQRGASLPNGLGTVTRMSKTTVFMSDVEKVCELMRAAFEQAKAQGAPLVNGLYVQQRASQNKILEQTEEELKSRGIAIDHNSLSQALALKGFGITVTDELHYAKSRS
jgi:hypothetical protein